MKRFALKSVYVMAIMFIVSYAYADSYEDYIPNDAVSYAVNNYNRPYGSASNQNPFYDFDENCTNFVSQCILGGLIGTNNAHTAYNNRDDFDIDKNASSIYKWYYINLSDSGTAFRGAKELYEYAVHNHSYYKGLHFQYVTHDTTTTFMDYGAVEKGDIIFADWEHDGIIDHSMIVTNIQWWRSGYNEIRLTYQGTEGVIGKTNIGLGDINEEKKINGQFQAVFYVYRPIDYNPQGL